MKPILTDTGSTQQTATLIIGQALQQAAAHHQAGRFAEAEKLYHSILQVEPKHPDANHNLGLMAMQLGRAEMGLPYLQAAWEADPSIGQYWLTLTECLLEMGHSEDALLLMEDAIRRGIDLPQAQQLLMRAKSNHDSKIQPVGTVIGESTESRQVFKEPQPDSATDLQAGKKPTKAKTAKFGKSARQQEKAPSPQEINALAALFTEGKYTEAATLAQAMTERFPQHGFGWKMLGTVFAQIGRSMDALMPMQKAAVLSPDDVGVHYNLGITFHGLGRLSEAEASCRRALQVKPDYAEAHYNLGTTLKDMGRLGEAEASYRRALQIKPDYAEAHNNLGITLHGLGRLVEAEASFRQALQVKPNYAEAHSNLGITLQELGRLGEAEASYLQALQVRPDYAEAHNNLGNTLKDMGRIDEAEASFLRVLQVKPDYAKAHCNLGGFLVEQWRLDEAEASCQRALEINPNLTDAHNNLGNALKELGRLDEAEASFRRALEIEPGFAEAHSNLGNTFKDMGRLVEAEASYRKALQIRPDYANAHSNLLYALLFYPGGCSEDILAACRVYDEQFCLPHRGKWPDHGNSREFNRRLRIGYVSPDFRRHAVAYFAEPILANHDKSQVEIFCYAEVKREDEMTGRFRQLADHWHSTVGLSDEAAAQMVRDHRIDILVDLAGHTSGNRLLTFARKPAPIQITYLGYPGSTGLSAMDYRITDRHADPEGIADTCYTERLLRLPDSLWCYRPSADMPEVSSLPALTRGYLTFGSFNNFNKIDQPTVALWAELLRALPTARLMMLTVPEGEARLRMAQRFAELGIDAQRLEFHGKLNPIDFHRKFLEVDVNLDPVNVNGATTTCESLWMGVPTISLVGTRFLTRAGLSILSTAGFTDFAAASPEGYIRIAAHLADNLPLLADIRAGLRDHLLTSPLVDEAGFTRNLENLYREAWGKWCET